MDSTIAKVSYYSERVFMTTRRVRQPQGEIDNGEMGLTTARRIRQPREGFDDGRWGSMYTETAGRDVGIKAEPHGPAFYTTQPVHRYTPKERPLSLGKSKFFNVISPPKHTFEDKCTINIAVYNFCYKNRSPTASTNPKRHD